MYGKRKQSKDHRCRYLRDRSGKSARLKGKDFDRVAVNDTTVEEPEVEVVETPEETTPTETAETEKTEEKTEA